MTVIVWVTNKNGTEKLFESSNVVEVETGLTVAGMPFIQLVDGNKYEAWYSTRKEEYSLKVKA